MSKKTKIIAIVIVVVIVAILAGIFTYKYVQKSKSTGTEWGDKYYIYLKEAKEKSAEERQTNYGITELVEDPKIQFCNFEENKEPQMLISYMQDGRKCTNIYYINNDGNVTYTFTENGDFTFEYTDEAGNKGKVKAIVNWIDKEAPTAAVSYDITDKTNKEVIATLGNASEEITIINNDGKDTYTFTKNGNFTFEFVDKAGNKGIAKAEVTWIDKVAPVATITYSTESETTEPVIATITFDKENVTVEGGNTHTFTENGEYTFEFIDEAGNMGMATAEVNWIEKEPDIPTPPEKNPSFEITLNSSKETLISGEEFEINVAINNIRNIENGILALGGQFEYDEDVLEILEIKGQENWNMDENSFNDDNFKFVTENGEYIKQNSNIMKIKLQVKESIEDALDTNFKIKSIVGTNAEIDINAKDAEIDLHIDKIVEEDPRISSEKYIIDENIISRVLPETTLSDFKSNVTANREFTITDEEGNTIGNDDIIKTGMTLHLTEDIEFTLIVIGDINKDGVITITDLAQLKEHIIELEILTGDRYLAADIDGNGEVTITDLAQLKMIIVGLMEI